MEGLASNPGLPHSFFRSRGKNDVDSGRHHVRKYTRPSGRFFPRLRKKLRGRPGFEAMEGLGLRLWVSYYSKCSSLKLKRMTNSLFFDMEIINNYTTEHPKESLWGFSCLTSMFPDRSDWPGIEVDC